MSPALNLASIRQRAELLREMRSFFDERGFFEVQPPCLSRDCVVDAYLEPLSIESQQLQIGSLTLPPRFYLQTSPESAMKRILAQGAPSIYSIGPVFRAGERGELHNPEFTMLEWYDVEATIEDGIRLLGELASALLRVDRYDVVRYQKIFSDHLQIDPIDSPLQELVRLTRMVDADLALSIADDRDAMLDLLLTRRIQPHLGLDRPLILTHYPLSQAALAKQACDDPRCALRFELFVGGVEIANGYDELLDADELLRRYQQNQIRRTAGGRKELPLQTSLLEAMRAGLPACTGVAMGVDRMLMVQQGYRSIDQVLPLPIEKA